MEMTFQLNGGSPFWPFIYIKCQMIERQTRTWGVGSPAQVCNSRP